MGLLDRGWFAGGGLLDSWVPGGLGGKGWRRGMGIVSRATLLGLLVCGGGGSWGISWWGGKRGLDIADLCGRLARKAAVIANGLGWGGRRVLLGEYIALACQFSW